MKSSVIRTTSNSRGQQSNYLSSETAGNTGGAKLTPEMCRAIKRQEVTSAMDYWRVGYNGITTQPQPHEKRPSYSRLTQINLDFPSTFLPNVSGQQQKPRRKEAAGLVLQRSRTTIMPTILQTKARVEKVPTNKKSVHDLTCLQLADTLFASKNSAFAGFFNFAIPKTSYGDFFGNVPESNERETCSNFDNSNKVVPTQTAKLHELDHRNRSTGSAIKYRTFQADDNKTIEERDRQLCSPTSPVYPARTNELLIESKNDLKPQKSILKNGASKHNEENDANVFTDSYQRESSATLHYISPTSRNQGTHLKLEAINPVIERNISPRQAYIAQNQSVDLKLVSDFANRKRSVRFNSDNEIREYKPCEPVSFC